MLNWDSVKNFHVVKKLSYLLGRWFKVDLLFINDLGKIQKELFEEGYPFKNHFLKVQMNLNYGADYLMKDIENLLDKREEKNQKFFLEKTFFGKVNSLIYPIQVEGESLGFICVYPFLTQKILTNEENEIREILKDSGATDEDALNAVKSLKVLDDKEFEYLSELVDLIGKEIMTYHVEISKRDERIIQLNSEVGTRYSYHSMIGHSHKMQQLYALLERIKKTESTVLIQGENGTGKELVAKAIHFQSSRKENIFLAQNCSAFNDNLLDSELFGHVKGSFTGAVRDKKGLFEIADGGTLFLDEIGDTTPTMQVKLLRVLQEGTFLPVGATTPKKVNVRIIAATNRDLKSMIDLGTFREDFYYRINVINVLIPPLRERKEDILLLAKYFLDKRCEELGYKRKEILKDAMEKMVDYPWPGNIRELENEIERIIVLSAEVQQIDNSFIGPKILDFFSLSKQSRPNNGAMLNLKKAIEDLEILMISEGLKKFNYNKSKLAKELGISRANLIMKIEKYGLDKRRKILEAV